nr:histone acetyltransferase KAT6A-like [Aegilops tauschii subsp. strangulata]
MPDQSDSQNKSEEQRRKRTSESKDEDYVAAEEEVNSKKKVVKKEFGTTVSTKPGMHKKALAKRVPMSKGRASTHETIEFTLEPKEAGAGKKRKERFKKTMAKVIGRSSMMRDPAEDEEEEDAAPAPKAQKLMGDVIKSGAAPSKPKTAPKASTPAPKTAPNRSTRNIPAAEKNKAPMPETEVEEEEDAEAQVLRKLKPKIPDHDDNHPVTENMKIRKDADKKPIVCEMKWADQKYIDNNEDHFPGVHESFRLCGVDAFVGTRYQSTVAEWAKLINAPAEHEDDIDAYAKKKKIPNSMANMYKEIPDKALETHKMGSLFDVPQKFKVMSLIVETINMTTID